jgi:hypothetical protein
MGLIRSKAKKQLMQAQVRLVEQDVRDRAAERLRAVLAGELPPRTVEERLALRKKRKAESTADDADSR